MSGPSIYEYLDYRAFLADWYDAKKVANPRFSHRAFVRRTGQRSPSLLKDVIEGRRNLTPPLVDGFSQALRLDADEKDFFAALVQLAQATSTSERNDAWTVIAAQKRFLEARRLEGEGFECLSHWYYPAIRELVRLEDFDPDPAWIARRLRPSPTVEQVERALEVLVDLGLLVRDGDGYREGEDASVVTPREVAGLAVHNYHFGMLDRAREAIDDVDADERHFLGLTLAVPRSLVPMLKRELNKVYDRLLDVADSAVEEEGAEEVVQVGLHFFPLSRSDDA